MTRTLQWARKRPSNDNVTVSVKKARASHSGRRGEQILAAYHVAARHEVAHLVHIPTPTVGAPPHLRYASPSIVDSLGFMLDGTGRVVAEEIKTCSSKSRFNLKEVEPHQAQYLRAVAAAGGVAVLTIVWGPDGAVCTIPFDLVDGAISLTGEEILRFAVRPQTYLRRFLVAPARPHPSAALDPRPQESPSGAAPIDRSMGGVLRAFDTDPRGRTR